MLPKKALEAMVQVYSTPTKHASSYTGRLMYSVLPSAPLSQEKRPGGTKRRREEGKREPNKDGLATHRQSMAAWPWGSLLGKEQSEKKVMEVEAFHLEVASDTMLSEEEHSQQGEGSCTGTY